MWGQWLGRIEGTNSAIIMFSIDEDSPFRGALSVSEDDPTKPSFHATLEIKQNANIITGTLNQFTLFSFNSDPAIKLKEQKQLPNAGTIEGVLKGLHIEGTWKMDIGTNGTFSLDKLDTDLQFDNDRTMEWDEFKVWALSEKNRNPNLIFRGHKDSTYCLKTSLHRTGRRNINRYSQVDIPVLERHIANLTGRAYRLDDAYEHGELLYLAQHHGFPTPLLDWTESPFIAAFFAFDGVPKNQNDKEKPVRIFMFDPTAWHEKHHRVLFVDDPRPSFSVHIFRSRDNKRALPQQSVVTFSNICDIDGFVNYYRDKDKVKYLLRIDLPAKNRNVAMKELQYMGITAASMFPGLDGMCAALKEKYF